LTTASMVSGMNATLGVGNNNHQNY